MSSAEDQSEERVKVDRKRFEQMLSDPLSIGCDADSFFRRVMRSTNTQIMWPPKLKPGTKSKKDPHVRITGSPNSINAAKEIIFEQLDTRRNRVTLKMDVAFTDHSHIIGKGGRSIQRVMDETGCHIHFPDSNRTNTAEKSNQVSIAGSAEGVEQSRCRIREMLPINLQFDLPLNNGLHSPPTLDPQSPHLQAIQQTYGITITFRCDGGSKCSNNSYFASSRIITVAVRGARSHLFGLRQGLSVLIEYLTGFRANSINVPLTMTIDVAVQHHAFIAGRANCNIRSIMQSTGAVISMPDLTSLSCASSTSSLTSSGQNQQLSNSSGLDGACSSSNSASALDTPHSMSMGLAPSLPTTSSSISDLTSICATSGLGQQQLSVSSSSSSLINSLSNQTFHGSNPNLATSSVAASLGNVIGGSGGLGNRKTAIVIKGQNFESVYSAWQELLGYLPLILIFDLKEGQDLDAVLVTKLMEQMRQISILIKPKQRQNTKSIVVRGPERDSRLLFEVRRQILKLDDSEVPQFAALEHQQIQQTTNQVHQKPQQASPTATKTTTINNNTLIQQPTSADLQMKAIRAILDPNLERARHPTPYWAGLGFSKSVSEPKMKDKVTVGSLFSSNLIDERRISYSNEGIIHDLANSLQSLSSIGRPTSSKIFTEMNQNNNANLMSMNNNNNNNSNNNNLNYINNNTNSNCSPGANSNNNNMILEKKLNNLASCMIDPNNNLMSHNSNIDHSNGNSQSNGSGNSNNNIVSPNSAQPNLNNNHKISSCLRLAVFLGRIGLVQYLGLFTQHDIDLEMLVGLTEADFTELGLPYFHRRKLAIAISEVKSTIQNERVAAFTSSLSSTFDAAPGAERSKRQKARCSQGELSDIWSM